MLLPDAQPCAYHHRQEDVTEVFKRLRQSETTGRPLGAEDWIDKLTAMTGRELKAKKRGAKRKKKD